MYILSSSRITIRSRSMSDGASCDSDTMSKSTSTASSRRSAGTRVQKTVTSLSVEAFIEPPTPSIASAISFAVGRRLVPLKKRCSTKCDAPPMRSSSKREPTPSIRTRLADARSGSSAVRSLAPPLSSWRQCVGAEPMLGQYRQTHCRNWRDRLRPRSDSSLAEAAKRRVEDHGCVVGGHPVGHRVQCLLEVLHNLAVPQELL